MFFEELDINKEYIIIGFPELKPYVLRKKSANPRLNLKFFTLENLENDAFGVTNIGAIKESIHLLDDDYSLTKKFLSYIRKGVNPEIDPRVEKLSNFLKDNRLSEYDYNYRNVFKGKEIYILGYTKENKELLHALEKTGIKVVDNDSKDGKTAELNKVLYPTKVIFTKQNFLPLSRLFDVKKFDITKFLRNDEEIRYAFIKINMLLQSGVKPQDIEIITDVNTNYFFLKLYEKEFRLCLDLQEHRTLYDTKIAKVIEKNIDTLTSENISSLDDKTEYYNDIVDILNYYDFFNLKHKMLNFKAILKDYSITEHVDTESIKVTNRLDFVEGKHIFILGFDSTFYSQVNKNNDYFDDELKEKYGLNGTQVLNIEGDSLYEYFLYTNNDFHIYFHESDGTAKEIAYYFLKWYPDEKEQPKHFIEPEVLPVDYSVPIAKAYYSLYENMFTKFFTRTEYYDLYHNKFKELEQYDSKYTKINLKADDLVKISYTNLNTYFECPFKYYCKNVLKIDDFEDTFFTISGKMIHAIMEHVYDDAYDFDKAYEEVYPEYQDLYNPLDLCLLSKLMKSARYVFDKNKQYYKKSQIKNTYCEKYVEVFNDKDNPTHKVFGYIDSVLYAEDKGTKAVQIIDYKTGETKITPAKFKYGLNLQLPIYHYLISHSYLCKNAPISGVYYVNFNDKRYNNFYENKFESSYPNYKKIGLTKKDLKLIDLFDVSLSLNKVSDTIDGIKLKVDGGFAKGGFNDMDFDEPLEDKDGHKISSMIEQIFDHFEKSVRENDYIISPYHQSNSDKTACKYCEFHDMCFDNDDFVRIKQALFHIDGLEYDDEGKEDA